MVRTRRSLLAILASGLGAGCAAPVGRSTGAPATATPGSTGVELRRTRVEPTLAVVYTDVARVWGEADR